MTAKEIVEALNKYIIGQDEAKRAVAIALKNRERRLKIDGHLRDEISPKNIIMSGPTGVGKTEIARRLAKIVDAPFIKVEATKFTEVGYVGRDVDSMIRDLVEESLRIVKDIRKKKVEEKAKAAVIERIADIMLAQSGDNQPEDDESAQYTEMVEKALQPFLLQLGSQSNTDNHAEDKKHAKVDKKAKEEQRAKLIREIADGLHDDETIEITIRTQPLQPTGDIAIDLEMHESGPEGLLHTIFGKEHTKTVTVSEAKKLLSDEEAEKLIDIDACKSEAVQLAEQSGIVFIDEIDKIASSGSLRDNDVSRDGVQRDILPIVEGCTVKTKYGSVRTDHILFIAAGAFHVASVSDLMPELQGRFPICVELSPLKKAEYRQILTQPQNAVILQYKALLETDKVYIEFADDALDLIAEYAELYNDSHENIGARRIHMLLERILSDILFDAGENGDEELHITIDTEYVKKRMTDTIGSHNPNKYIV